MRRTIIGKGKTIFFLLPQDFLTNFYVFLYAYIYVYIFIFLSHWKSMFQYSMQSECRILNLDASECGFGIGTPFGCGRSGGCSLSPNGFPMNHPGQLRSQCLVVHWNSCIIKVNKPDKKLRKALHHRLPVTMCVLGHFVLCTMCTFFYITYN